ncbi:unnamed protein product [Calypogeia fissa]
MFLDPMFHLNAKVEDVWNLRKVFVRDLVGAKAWLVYPMKSTPPDPGYLLEFLEVVKHAVVLSQNGMIASGPSPGQASEDFGEGCGERKLVGDVVK